MVKNFPAPFHHSSSYSQQLKSVSIAASLNAIAAAAVANSQIQDFKGKRKSYPDKIVRDFSAIDKMLSDRLDSTDSKKFFDTKGGPVDRKTFCERGIELWLSANIEKCEYQTKMLIVFVHQITAN